MSGAAVTAKNVETGESRSTVTDDVGHYWVPSLAVGEYEVHVTKQGFQEQVRGGIHLVVGQEASVDVALKLGQVTEQVKVIADAPVVSVTAADISGVVGEQQVKDLPLNGRSYDELMTLNPGVVIFTSEKTGGIGVSNSTAANMFSVAGNRPQQNMFLLNGIEFTGAAENNMQPGGVSGQMLGVDAIREFNLLSDTYGAEYGKHPGGQVTIVTQSGTNQWHGSVFEYLRNNVLDAPNFFDPGSAPPFRRNQFGGSMGGPIQKDKTFVFANYEGFRQSLHQTSVAFVPDAAVRSCIGVAGCSVNSNGGAPVVVGSSCPAAQPQNANCLNEIYSLLNLWPVANGPDRLNRRQSGHAQRHRRKFRQSASNHPRRFRHRASRSYLFRQGLARRGLHRGRQRGPNRHGDQSVYVGRDELARTGCEHRRNARLLAHCSSTPRASVSPARAIFLQGSLPPGRRRPRFPPS